MSTANRIGAPATVPTAAKIIGDEERFTVRPWLAATLASFASRAATSFPPERMTG